MTRDEIQIRAEIAYAARKSREEGEREGEAKAKLDAARSFKAAGIPVDTIVQCTGLSLDTVLGL